VSQRGTYLRIGLTGIAFAIPFLFATANLLIQPPDRFVPAATESDYFLPAGYNRLIFDDCDSVAWMIRAENASRGRLAGRIDETGKPFHVSNDTDLDRYRERIAAKPPFAERYFLEYPPMALAFFRLCYLASGSNGTLPVSAGLLDEHEFNFTCHAPETPAERELYRGMRRGLQASVVLLFLALVGVMLLVQRGIGPGGIASASPWLCILPAMLYFTPCRFDILPAGLVLLAIAFTARGRPNLGALALGFAIAFKLYPLILAPMILRFAFQTWGRAAVWAVCCAFPALLANGAMLLTDGLPGVVVPFQFQFGRGVETLFCFYGRLLPMAFADGAAGTLFRNGSVALLVVGFCYRKPPDVESLLRRCALAVMLFVSLQVLYSPQWWLWIAALLIPLARTHRGLTALIVLSDLLIYATFPLAYDRMILGAFDDEELTRLADALAYGRALLWAGIAVVLVKKEIAATKREIDPPDRGTLPTPPVPEVV